jgi:PAS domain S-box-containing protein
MPNEFVDDAEGLRKVLESVPGFVMMIDRGCVIRYINRLEPGYRHHEVIGMPAEAVLTPGSRRAFLEAFDAVLSREESVEYEGEVVLPDGSEAWYRSHMSPYRDGGETLGVVLVADNITELRRARESAETLRKLLPICSWCDRIRGEEGMWESMEAYVARKESARVSHGLCEDCFQRQVEGLPDWDESDDRRA